MRVQVNLDTSFNIVKAGVKAMIKEEGHQQHSGGSASSKSPHRRGGGSIVLVSAALASHGIPNYEAMSAAKAAVEGEPRLSEVPPSPSHSMSDAALPRCSGCREWVLPQHSQHFRTSTSEVLHAGPVLRAYSE